VDDGVEGQGPTIMAIDNLPGLLPVEASTFFSKKLKEFVPAIVNANYDVDFETLNLPAPIKRALIGHKGELTPNYRYLEKFLSNDT
jgi:alpha-aminoadipic semialdehyde synthase